MTDAEKAERYDQIAAVVEDHFSLMGFQQANNASSYNIEFAKVNAYRKIAEIVTGVDPL
jgi:hypothetical protein